MIDGDTGRSANEVLHGLHSEITGVAGGQPRAVLCAGCRGSLAGVMPYLAYGHKMVGRAEGRTVLVWRVACRPLVCVRRCGRFKHDRRYLAHRRSLFGRARERMSK